MPNQLQDKNNTDITPNEFNIEPGQISDTDGAETAGMLDFLENLPEEEKAKILEQLENDKGSIKSSQITRPQGAGPV